MQLQNHSFYITPSLGFRNALPLLGSARNGVSLIFRSPFEVSSSRYMSKASRAESLASSIQRRIYQKILSSISIFDPQFIQIAREVERINADETLSKEDKQKKINEVRERHGLSKEEMKRHVTEPLEKIYEDARAVLNQEVEELKSNQKRLADFYGKDSPQALQAARTLDRVQKSLEPLQKKLQQSQETYHGMYQKGGCVKKLASGIGGIVKGLAQTFTNVAKGIVNPQNWFKPSFWLNTIAPLAVSLIPGVGLIAAVGLKWARIAYAAYNTIKAVAQKNWQAALGGMMGIMGKVSLSVATKVSSVVQKIDAWRQKINWSQFVNTSKSDV